MKNKSHQEARAMPHQAVTKVEPLKTPTPEQIRAIYAMLQADIEEEKKSGEMSRIDSAVRDAISAHDRPALHVLPSPRPPSDTFQIPDTAEIRAVFAELVAELAKRRESSRDH